MQPSLRQTIAQDVRLPLLETPLTAAGIAKLAEDDPMLLTELLCGAHQVWAQRSGSGSGCRLFAT